MLSLLNLFSIVRTDMTEEVKYLKIHPRPFYYSDIRECVFLLVFKEIIITK